MYIVEYFNARIGAQADIIVDVDTDLPNRNSIDITLNSHGRSLLEFLKDNKLCIINGRLNPKKDNFTLKFLSTRGKSVVDYFITCHDNLSYCKSFEVLPTIDVIDKFGLEQFIESNSKCPDHSILQLCFFICK